MVSARLELPCGSQPIFQPWSNEKAVRGHAGMGNAVERESAAPHQIVQVISTATCFGHHAFDP